MTAAGLHFFSHWQISSAILETPVRFLESTNRTYATRVLGAATPLARILEAFTSASFVFWWIAGTWYATSLCVLSGVTDPPIRKLFHLFAHAFLPLVPVLTLVSAITVWSPPTGDPTVFIGAEDPNSLRSATADYMDSVNASPTMIAAKVLENGGTIWVFALWAVALRSTLRLSILRVFLIVGSWVALLHAVGLLTNYLRG